MIDVGCDSKIGSNFFRYSVRKLEKLKSSSDITQVLDYTPTVYYVAVQVNWKLMLWKLTSPSSV